MQTQLTLGITGHRPDKLNMEYDLKGPLTTKIKEKLQLLIDELKPTRMISGMALGVDTIFAILALENKIPLTAAVPFVGQELKWPFHSQELYNEILKQSGVTTKIISTGGYSPQKLQIRNMWLVDNCNKLVAVWDGSEGGTANCIKYAQTTRRDIIMMKLNEPITVPGV